MTETQFLPGANSAFRYTWLLVPPDGLRCEITFDKWRFAFRNHVDDPYDRRRHGIAYRLNETQTLAQSLGRLGLQLLHGDGGFPKLKWPREMPI